MDFNAHWEARIAINFNPASHALFHPDSGKPLISVREHLPLGRITPMKFPARKHGDRSPLGNNTSAAPIKMIPARSDAAFVLLESSNTHEVRHSVVNS